MKIRSNQEHIPNKIHPNQEHIPNKIRSNQEHILNKIHLKSYPILVFKCSLSLFLYMLFNLLLVQRGKLKKILI